jgi:methionyl-tRNA formyltransferase
VTGKAPQICVAGYSVFQGTVARALRDEGADVCCLATEIADPPAQSEDATFLETRGFSPRVAGIAEAIGAEYLLLDDINSENGIDAIKSTGAQIVLSCSAPILKKKFLNAFGGLVFNLHGSLRFRGRAAGSWLILSGDDSDSVILHWVDTGIDTGFHIEESAYSWDDDAYPIDIAQEQRASIEYLTRRFAQVARANDFPKGSPSPTRPYNPALKTQLDGWIDWQWSAEAIERVVRAFGWPYVGASSTLEYPNRSREHTLIARATVVHSGTTPHPMMAGNIIGREKGAWVDVQCGRDVLRIHTLRDGIGERAAASTIRLGSRFVGSSQSKGP